MTALHKNAWWCRAYYGVKRKEFEMNVLKNFTLVAFMKNLGIKETDALALYGAYRKIDVDCQGSVCMDDLCLFLDIEKSQYNLKALQLFMFESHKELGDRGRALHNRLTFEEFFVSAINYFTLSQDTLAFFAFQIMSGSKLHLVLEDVEEFAALLEPDPVRANQISHDLRDILGYDERKKIMKCNFDKFLSQSSRLSNLMFPAFRLQSHMQKRLMARRHWKRLAKKRRKAIVSGVCGMNLSLEFLRIKSAHLSMDIEELKHNYMHTPLVTPAAHISTSTKRRSTLITASASPTTTIDKKSEQRPGAGKKSKRASIATSIPTSELSKPRQAREHDRASISGSSPSPKMPSALHSPDSGAHQPRRRVSSYTANTAAVPGRRGSLFDGMDVYDPATAVVEANAALHQGSAIVAASAVLSGTSVASRLIEGSQARRRSLELNLEHNEKSRRSSLSRGAVASAAAAAAAAVGAVQHDGANRRQSLSPPTAVLGAGLDAKIAEGSISPPQSRVGASRRASTRATMSQSHSPK